MKNDIFYFDRWSKYLVADLHNAYVNYGLSLLLMSLIGVFACFIDRVFDLIFSIDNGGPSIFFRCAIMGACLIVVLMTVGKKCYGQVTDRKSGTNFVMLPVSALEKTFSMLFVCCVAVPVAYLTISLCADAVVCAIDSSCGDTIIYTLTNAWKSFSEWSAENPQFFMDGNVNIADELAGMQSLVNPLLYIDDVLAIVLCFLLGTLVFKTGKISKTIGCLILFSIAASIIISPIAAHYLPGVSDEAARNFISGLLSHAALWDTVNDTIVNLLLCTAIYFRIKTIKL